MPDFTKSLTALNLDKHSLDLHANGQCNMYLDRAFQTLTFNKHQLISGSSLQCHATFKPGLDSSNTMDNLIANNIFRGKIVLVAALDGTFQRLPFPEMLALVPLAEAVTKLQAVCMICFQVERSKSKT